MIAFDVSEIRYALRTLIKAPGPTVVMMLTLGVAVGAATVIYSVIDMVWHFLPAPKPDPSRLRRRDGHSRHAGGRRQRAAWSCALRRRSQISRTGRARSTTFEQFAGFSMGSASLTGVDVPAAPHRDSRDREPCRRLGSHTGAGPRAFAPKTAAPDRPAVTMLSHAFWQQHFSASPAVLGQTMLLDEVPHTIVGVLPREAGTGFFRDADVFTPLAARRARARRAIAATCSSPAG